MYELGDTPAISGGRMLTRVIQLDRNILFDKTHWPNRFNKMHTAETINKTNGTNESECVIR